MLLLALSKNQYQQVPTNFAWSHHIWRLLLLFSLYFDQIVNVLTVSQLISCWPFMYLLITWVTFVNAFCLLMNLNYPAVPLKNVMKYYDKIENIFLLNLFCNIINNGSNQVLLLCGKFILFKPVVWTQVYDLPLKCCFENMDYPSNSSRNIFILNYSQALEFYAGV